MVNSKLESGWIDGWLMVNNSNSTYTLKDYDLCVSKGTALSFQSEGVSLAIVRFLLDFPRKGCVTYFIDALRSLTCL